MLRVGLTGDLGSGKSTVARLLAAHGAIVFSSDEMAREMMRPGEPIYAAIVEHFGPAVLTHDGTLDRRALARIAFDPTHSRIEELNALIHPAVISEQFHRIEDLARIEPHAIVVIESALIFTTQYAPGNLTWRERFDAIVLVTAPEPLKISRFIHRVSNNRQLTSKEHSALEADARRRLAVQQTSDDHAAHCLLIANDGTLEQLSAEVSKLWDELQHLENDRLRTTSAGPN
jgi:dephospho-CoA kinase